MNSLIDLLLSRQNELQTGLQIGNEALGSVERHGASHDDTSLCQGCRRHAQVLNPSDDCRDVILHFDGKTRHERTIDIDGLGKRNQGQVWHHRGAPYPLLLCEKGKSKVAEMFQEPSETLAMPTSQSSCEGLGTSFNLPLRDKSDASLRPQRLYTESAAVHFNQAWRGFRRFAEAA